MDAFLRQFQHLKIPLEEIRLATNNFNDEMNCIGVGGFGKVYKGEVSHSKGRSMAAIKRLDRRYGQGIPEFLKEISTLSRYNHENLISLLGFCYQGDEMILVYENASRGSLDRYLSSPHLTWTQRIKICLDAAKGLSYLHDPRETHQRLIHCDVKSSNILLDEQWNAKLSDLGLSIMGPANEQQSVIITYAVGTPGYCDPQYAMTHTLTKESDVYSFGVVLFEVLCGTLCCTYSNGCVEKILVPTWIESYRQKKLNDVIFKNPTIHPLDQASLELISDIAYRCLKESREDRPNMSWVVSELEIALETQTFSEEKLVHSFYERIAKSAKTPLNYRCEDDLKNLLSKGILLNDGNTWFSLNKKGENCVMVSFVKCVEPAPTHLDSLLGSEYNSRFAAGPYKYDRDMRIKVRVKTQFLLPRITYTVNLVYKVDRFMEKVEPVLIKYKLSGETRPLISNHMDMREDGWCMCELYQFTSNHRSIDLEILFDGFHRWYSSIKVEGIDFRPWEKVEHEDEKQPISYLDENWEDRLPTDYEDLLKRSIDSVQWTSKKEAYSIFHKGFLMNDGKEWISVDNNGKKCYMLSAAVALTYWRGETSVIYSDDQSRFGEAYHCFSRSFDIQCRIPSQLLSSKTTYASYLVYKLPKEQSAFEAPVIVEDKKSRWNMSNDHWYIYFVSPQTPIIKAKTDRSTRNLANRPNIIKGLPRKRKDGWMEVQIWGFQTAITTYMIDMRLGFSYTEDKKPEGLIVEGIEFRPL